MKERFPFVFVNVLLSVFVTVFLVLIQTRAFIIILLLLAWFVPLLLSYILDFGKKKRFYDSLQSTLESLDQKYLLAEMMESPSFLEGKIIEDVLKTTEKQMHEHVNVFKQQQLEYREYIEAWVHEIKTPIATSKLMIENQRNELSKALYAELQAIEEYVEQALYYARSTSANKDYIVKECSLKGCLNTVIKKNARMFIQQKIQLQLADITDIVYSDEKWVEFIINQIIVNSINYCCHSETPTISISTSKQEHNVVLRIADNGIGIDEKDIERVFEKGFTGENGRQFRKATGIGLYLCKTLADKLHLGLTISSVKGQGTEVCILFPTSKVLLLES